jgi:predicted AAA+ superfamily ATPase
MALLSEMGNQLLKAAKMHAEGELERAKTNVLVYLNNSTGIGEHSDVVEAIQEELDKMASAHDRLEMIEKYFKK